MLLFGLEQINKLEKETGDVTPWGNIQKLCTWFEFAAWYWSPVCEVHNTAGGSEGRVHEQTFCIRYAPSKFCVCVYDVKSQMYCRDWEGLWSAFGTFLNHHTVAQTVNKSRSVKHSPGLSEWHWGGRREQTWHLFSDRVLSWQSGDFQGKWTAPPAGKEEI